MNCPGARIALGAYVLGSLDPAERSAVETHLTSCPACRRELAELAGLPGLLGRLTEPDVVAAPVRPGPDLLERLLAEVARQRRRARRRLVVVAAAAVVVLLGTGGAMAALRADAPRPRVVAAVGSPSGGSTVHATFGVVGRAWGTEVTLALRGVPPGERCRLLAVAGDGHTEVAGSWEASYRGGASLTGATSIPASELRALRVVTYAGRELVAVELRP